MLYTEWVLNWKDDLFNNEINSRFMYNKNRHSFEYQHENHSWSRTLCITLTRGSILLIIDKLITQILWKLGEIRIPSGHTFAHVPKALLSRHVQNHGLIGSLISHLGQKTFSQVSDYEIIKYFTQLVRCTHGPESIDGCIPPMGEGSEQLPVAHTNWTGTNGCITITNVGSRVSSKGHYCRLGLDAPQCIATIISEHTPTPSWINQS